MSTWDMDRALQRWLMQWNEVMERWGIFLDHNTQDLAESPPPVHGQAAEACLYEVAQDMGSRSAFANPEEDRMQCLLCSIRTLRTPEFVINGQVSRGQHLQR